MANLKVNVNDVLSRNVTRGGAISTLVVQDKLFRQAIQVILVGKTSCFHGQNKLFCWREQVIFLTHVFAGERQCHHY